MDGPSNPLDPEPEAPGADDASPPGAPDPHGPPGAGGTPDEPPGGQPPPGGTSSSSEPPPPQQPPGPPAPPPPSSGIPWEQRDHLGFAEGLFQTLRQSLFQPTQFFSQLPPDGPTPPPPLGAVGSPILYAILVGVPSLVIGIFWQFVASSIGILEGESADAVFGLGAAVFFACLTPILIPLGLLIMSAIFHLFLILFSGANASFLATFRVVSYASSPEVFQIVPLCGGLVSAVWGLVLAIIGLREVHKTTTGKAAAAVLLPGFVCCGLVFLIIISTAGFLAGISD
jgi:hypothetical protein